MLRLALLSTLVAQIAHAEHAVGVNPPLRWADGGALALSGYLGLTGHHAIRANVSRYDHGPGLGAIAFVLGAEDEGAYRGKVTDLGLAWMLSPRRLCDGFSLELGVLVRKRATEVEDAYAPEFRVATDSTSVGGRALVGWSWRLHDLFAAVQVGISGGYEVGDETVQRSEFEEMTTTRDVARHDVTAEGFVRFGAVFD